MLADKRSFCTSSLRGALCCWLRARALSSAHLLLRQAKSAADRATSAVTDNPAKEFANRGKAAVRDALPTAGPAEWDVSSLQVNVNQKLQAQASQTAKKASSKVPPRFTDPCKHGQVIQ